MDEQMIKMSLEDMPKFVNDENPELAIARLLFLSTRPNSHKFVISEEVLREYAPTVLGKFVIGNLNYFDTDVTTHLQEPDIFGYFPTEQTIEFVRAEDGYLDAYANAVVSKIYATKVYNIFTKENFRSVSVEMMIRYSNEEEQLVSSFNICGVTILGKDVNPSVPQAHMEIIKFSADRAEKFYQQNSILDKMAKLANANFNNVETEVLGTLNPTYNVLNLKNVTNNNEQSEEQMAKLEEKEKDVVMDKPTDKEVQEAPKEEDANKLAETSDSEEDKQEEKEEVKASDEEEKLAEDDSDDADKKDEEEDDEKEKLSCENAKLAAQVADYEAKFTEMETELTELRKFKADTEEEQKMSVVLKTLAEVKEVMNEEDYAKFEERGKECTLTDINAWRNEVLANVTTVLMSKKEENESHLRMSVEEETKSKNLWDRF